MIDRTWWIWQMQDLSTRLTAVSGGTSMFGFGSKNGTLSDNVDLNVNAPAVKLGDLLDTLNGPFCYVYV
jgi:tyrosinase